VGLFIFFMENLLVKNKETSSREKILLVDDDREILTYLEQIARLLKLETIKAETGNQAIEKFMNHRPGVVVLDYRLPDINGDHVLSKIKELSPFSQVIMITGHGKYEVAVKSLQGGASYYFKKPVKKDEIMEAIENSCSVYRDITSVTETTNILVADGSDVLRAVEKNLPEGKWDIVYADHGKKALELAALGETDIVILDLELSDMPGMQLLSELKKLPFQKEIIITAAAGDEQTAVEAVKNGAFSYLRKPQDLTQLTSVLQKAKKSLELKRMCGFKISELKDAREVVAKITENRSIEVDIFKPHGKISSSFAKRFFDSVPVGIVAVDKNKNVIYSNRAVDKNAAAPLSEVDENFVDMLKNIGIYDVELDILREEINRLLSEDEDIETVTLGRKEYLTLTNLVIITRDQPVEAVLMVARIN